MLFESASGFGLFEVKEFDEISQSAEKMQEAVRCVCSGSLQLIVQAFVWDLLGFVPWI